MYDHHEKHIEFHGKIFYKMNATEKEWVPIREATRITSLSHSTLRRYANEHKVHYLTTPAGQRKFHKPSLEKFLHPTISCVSTSHTIGKKNILYARVSSRKQMDVLQRQITFLQTYSSSIYDSYDVITDIASGINFQRKGLRSILEFALQGIIGEVVVAHRDRLCRFGFELIQFIIEKGGGKLTVVGQEAHSTPESELSDDLLSIVHIYSCLQMGRRKYKRNIRNESHSNTIEDKSSQSNGCHETEAKEDT